MSGFFDEIQFGVDEEQERAKRRSAESGGSFFDEFTRYADQPVGPPESDGRATLPFTPFSPDREDDKRAAEQKRLAANVAEYHAAPLAPAPPVFGEGWGEQNREIAPESFGVDEQRIRLTDALGKPTEEEMASAPFKAMAAGLALGPIAGAVGKAGALLGDVIATSAVGGPAAGARIAAPAATAALPFVEGALLGEAGGPVGGPSSEAAAVAGRLASQRGHALEPISGLIDAVGDAAKKLTPFPGLGGKRMPNDPSQTLEEGLVLARAKMAGAGDTAAERAVSLRGNEQYDKLLEDMLHNRDLAQTASRQVTKGGPVLIEGGISGQDAINRALAAEAQLSSTPEGAAYLAQKLPGVDAWRTEILDMARASGQVDPAFQGLPDYVPHVYKGRLQDEYLPGLLTDTDAATAVSRAIAANQQKITMRGRQAAPGGGGFVPHAPVKSQIQTQAEKHRTGSTKEMAGDPLSRLAVKAASVERKAILNKFVDSLKPLSVTDDVLVNKTVAFDPELHKIYDFGNGKFEILPRDVAEAVSAAGTLREDMDPVVKILSAVRNITAGGILKYNPGYHAKQQADDFVSGFMNAPWGRRIEYVKEWWNHGKKLKAAFADVRAGKYSPELADYRRQGLLTDIYESLVKTDGEVREISEKATKPASGIGARIDQMGKVRETRAKAALAALFRAEGATADRASYVANKWMGNYISQSATGRTLNAIVPFFKWATTAIRRLSTGMAEDPVTGGKFTKRGAAHSPLKDILPLATIASIWNYYQSGGEDKSFDGFIIPGTDTKVGIPGYGTLMTDPTKLDEGGFLRFRTNPAIRVMAERAFGGKKAVPEEAVTADTQARIQAKQGGIGGDNPAVKAVFGDLLAGHNLSPQNQADLEKFAAAAGVLRRATSADSSERGGLSEFARMMSPLRISDAKQERQSHFYRSRDSILQEAATLVERKQSGELKPLIKEWIAGGGDPKDFIAELKAGKRRAAEYEKLTREQRARLRLAR